MLPEDEWEETEKREEAFRRKIATLKCLNRKLKDFTGQILGGFVSVRVERPSLSVICWSTATCEECKLAKVLLVPEPSLACTLTNQSLFPQAPLCLLGRMAPYLRHPCHVPPFNKGEQSEVKKQEHSVVVVEVEKEDCLTLPSVAPPSGRQIWKVVKTGHNNKAQETH